MDKKIRIEKGLINSLNSGDTWMFGFLAVRIQDGRVVSGSYANCCYVNHSGWVHLPTAKPSDPKEYKYTRARLLGVLSEVGLI